MDEPKEPRATPDFSKSFSGLSSKKSGTIFPVSSSRFISHTTPAMVSWLIRHSGGAIKTERQAHTILLVISFICLALTFYLMRGVLGYSQVTPPGEIQPPNLDFPAIN